MRQDQSDRLGMLALNELRQLLGIDLAQRIEFGAIALRRLGDLVQQIGRYLRAKRFY
jgi:hypothetical protein